MTEETIQWAPGFWALGVGAVIGIVASFRIKAEKEFTDDDTHLRDLEEDVNHIIALLKDLDGYRDRSDEQAYKERRAALEVKAADALRARDAYAKKLAETQTTKANAGQKSAPTSVANPKSAKASGFLWGVGTMAVVMVLFLLLDRYSQERNPGDPMTGGPGMAPSAGASGAPQRDDPSSALRAAAGNSEVNQLVAHLTANPEDADATVRLASILLRAQAFKEAAMVNQRALQLAPDNADALVNDAMLKGARGDAQAALDGLEGVLQKHPKAYRAWFFKGMLAMQSGKMEQAKKSWTQFVALAPDGVQKDRIKAFLDGGMMPMPGN